MTIEDIIYQTTREVYSVEDKLRIATLFLFVERQGSKELSELLYCKNHSQYIDDLNVKYKAYDVDFTINISNPNVKSAFYKTLEKVKEKWDSNGFLKAIADRDEFALAICDIINFNFDKVQFLQQQKQLVSQLALFT